VEKPNSNTDDLDQELGGNLEKTIHKMDIVNLGHSNNDVALEHMVLKLEKDGCTKCGLGYTSPKVVVSRGNLRSRLAIIGQNPGNQELVQGIPFVGPAGKLLDFLLEQSGLSGAKPYYTNVGLCGTPNNRPLNKEEQAICNQHWKAQVLQLRPKVILAVGKPAINAIIPETETMKVADIIEKTFIYDNKFESIKVFTIYHPSFILRQENQKPFENITIDKMVEIKNYLISIPKSQTLF